MGVGKMAEDAHLCDTCCNETQRCIDSRKKSHVKLVRICSQYRIKDSLKQCLRCTKQGLGSTSYLHFCPVCKTHFKTLAYIEGDQMGKFGVYCRGHYWNGDRMMTTTFSLQTMKAFCSDPYHVPKMNLPISRKKYQGEFTDQQFYRKLYELEIQDRTFLASMADYAQRKNEPLF